MDKYRHFFQHNLDLACFASTEGYFEEVNTSFTKNLGYENKELLGKKIIGFIHPDDTARTLRVMGVLKGNHKVVAFVNRFRMKSNAYKYLEWDSIANPETGQIYAIARDITDKINAEKEQALQAVRKEKSAARLAMRAAQLFSANQELAFQNSEKEKRAQELAVANNELDFQNEEKEKRALELLVANEELGFQNLEKEKRAAELSVSNKTLKRTKDYLQQYIRGMEELMFMTSHKVRQPIANILGVITLFDKALVSPDEMKKLLGFIKKSAYDLDSFTKDLMTYMRNLVIKKKEPGPLPENKTGCE